MHKIKIIVTLLTLTCALAAMAAPANGYFGAKTPGATKGPIAKFPLTITVTVGSTENVCTRNSKTTGFWNIQTSEEQVITKVSKQQQQPGTKLGPHEAITITDWGSCKSSGFPSNLTPCRLQAAQSKGATIGHGSIQTDCGVTLSTLSCDILLDQQAANHDLQTVNLENNETGEGVLIKANIIGITYKTVGAGCAAGGLPAEGHDGTIKTGENGNEALETSLQKII